MSSQSISNKVSKTNKSIFETRVGVQTTNLINNKYGLWFILNMFDYDYDQALEYLGVGPSYLNKQISKLKVTLPKRRISQPELKIKNILLNIGFVETDK